MVTKKFDFHSGSPEKQRVLKIVPTGIVAINIDGTIINTAFDVPLCKATKISKVK